MGVLPSIARLVEVELHAAAVEIEDVRGAGTIHVGELYSALIELVRGVEPRSVVHGDLGAEPTVAEVRPVTDLAVADADKVREAVARHVGQVDGLCSVGEHERRPALVVPLPGDALGWTEPLLTS